MSLALHYWRAITREWSSSLPSLFTSVGSGQPHRTSSKNYASRQTWRIDVVCGQLHHHHWLSDVRGCLPSASAFPVAAARIWNGFNFAAARHVCTLAACSSQSSEDDAAFRDSIFCFCRACKVTCHNRTR